MTTPDETLLTDMADGLVDRAEWAAWLADHPAEAAEIVIAQRVRMLMAELRAQPMLALPPDFEARLLDRIRSDTTLLSLLDFGLTGLGRTLLEIIALLIGVLPQAPEQQFAS